ncbi:hypothetical protein A2482_03425 [Candidatus Falkowbacteria bacterium RIFOXYC2_FULL_48_21]|uniref:Dockerin domain-containing protein n=1 Tax=Candidatus Falkowbacteria bacterium RIFOXYC2_FULL_48_21 TaxID=1798005 RepID=A0A1F5T503_9BACT|nr:MAG: hypothetical protein A2482_03425 [Candidatus Falkowbacteria bacterium RIFOXYC2_FULL_48_21]
MNYFFLGAVVLLAAAIPVLCLAVAGKNVTMSVTIIDPHNCYTKIIATPEKVATTGNFVGTLNRQVDGKLFFMQTGANWTNASMTYEAVEKSLPTIGATEYYNHSGICGQTGDMVYKTKKHLAKRISNVALNGVVNLDFTQGDTYCLKAGDINADYGDNKINSLDMSILVNDWNEGDVRADLNSDVKVNSLDSSILLANFNLSGD